MLKDIEPPSGVNPFRTSLYAALGELAPDHIDELSALLEEKVARPVQR